MVKINDLFDISKTIATGIFDGKIYPWEVLPNIHDFILALGATLPKDEYNHPTEGVWIAKDAVVYPTAFIGPCVIIDHGAQVKHCAFVRENAIIGKGATVGNSSELKNVILFDGVEVPHYNYVGDSILGFKAHMGAGAIISNLKSDKKNVIVKDLDRSYETGLRKMGAILGDFAEIGCNSVLNPGTIIGPMSNVYPLSSVRGVVPANHIYKNSEKIVKKY